MFAAHLVKITKKSPISAWCYPLIHNIASDLELAPKIKAMYHIWVKSVNLCYKGLTINTQTRFF